MYRNNQIFEYCGLNFKVEYHVDDFVEPPWMQEDGHGPVSDWTMRAKRPGEWVLTEDHGDRRYYDAQQAMRRARQEKWGVAGKTFATPGEQAAAAVKHDFEVLRGWCQDDWMYMGMCVTLCDDHGDETGITETLWGLAVGLPEFEPYLVEVAHQLADEIIASCQRMAA